MMTESPRAQKYSIHFDSINYCIPEHYCIVILNWKIIIAPMCLSMDTWDLQTTDCNAAFNSKCFNVSCLGDRGPTDQLLQCSIQFKIMQCVLTWGPETYRPLIAMQHSIQNVLMCLALGTGDLQTSYCNATFNSKCCNVS
jgi:hypothetical protein